MGNIQLDGGTETRAKAMPGAMLECAVCSGQKFHELNEADAQNARSAYGLDPDKFTVFLNAGWEGGGNIPHIFREFVRGELDVQAIFLAGRNEALRNEAELLAAEAKFPIKVIGYSDEVEQLMRAAT